MQPAEQMEPYEEEPDEAPAPEPEPFVPTAALIQAVAEALRPTGVRDRVKIRLAGGLTVFQVMDRLSEAVLDDLHADQDIPILARRQAVVRIEHALYELTERKQAKRTRVDMAMDLPGKGIRGVRIDAYKLL